MKKKILLMLLVLIMPLVLMFSGCNKQIFDFQYTFSRAYIKIGEEWIDLPISKWKDYEGEQLQIILTDGTVIVVSSINCILYNGTLPQNEGG